jgi:hypothetical protein
MQYCLKFKKKCIFLTLYTHTHTHVCVEYNSQNKHKITNLNINEAHFIQLSRILMMVVIAVSEILATCRN